MAVGGGGDFVYRCKHCKRESLDQGRTESVGKALTWDPNPACPNLGRSIKRLCIDENVV